MPFNKKPAGIIKGSVVMYFLTLCGAGDFWIVYSARILPGFIGNITLH